MKKVEENARVRAAYLEIISDAMRRANVQRVYLDGKSYERDSDRVQFVYCKERVVLTEVGIPILDSMELPISCIRKSDGYEVGVIAYVSWFQIKTLRNIAYEVYDWIRGEDWEDWYVVEKECIANFLDSGC